MNHFAVKLASTDPGLAAGPQRDLFALVLIVTGVLLLARAAYLTLKAPAVLPPRS